MNRLTNGLAISLVSAALLTPSAWAQSMTTNPNAIQPETTLSITATGEVTRTPDLAYITAGVVSEAKTAKEAMAANARDMDGVFKALKAAGIADNNMQTSNFSLNPRYDYVQDGKGSGRQVLAGYTVSNQVSVKVTQLDRLGTTLDALVSAGGNTLNGIRFGVKDDDTAQDEARRKAMQAAMQRASLYASAAGYQVARIVSIDENFQSSTPQPKVMMARALASEATDTQIASGELTFNASVSVLFELKK